MRMKRSVPPSATGWQHMWIKRVAIFAMCHRFWGLIGTMAQSVGDELRSEWVQYVDLLQLHTVQLSPQVGPGYATQTGVCVANGKEPFPNFSANGKTYSAICTFHQCYFEHVHSFIIPTYKVISGGK